ncbi:MAG: KpsF/GutQ family sugar-phosphate isomerase [Deltaproteobacteria bacterium]|nr:KpsF/GutQ family sugar-phosphate isomerase [Deltaproteobacteria bacterium]
MLNSQVLSVAREVLDIEIQALQNLKAKLDSSFEKAVDLLLNCRGKVVATGMGKSGQVCKKIAATMASTGTPAFFLHASEAIHGDLGMLARDDALLAISYSGETSELLEVVSLAKRQGIPVVSISGNQQSSLAKLSDVSLVLSIDKEACPLNLAPTASTTATLALGDALAVCLLKQRGFEESDFAKLHPGGSLGRRLLLRVKDLMHCGDKIPFVFDYTPVAEALMEMTTKRLGCTGVINTQQELIGIITDGDLRRRLGAGEEFLKKRAQDVMTKFPKIIHQEKLASEALHLMEQSKITGLFVHEERYPKKPIGFLHMHDLLQAKIV